jgi:hypothetical protein
VRHAKVVEEVGRSREAAGWLLAAGWLMAAGAALVLTRLAWQEVPTGRALAHLDLEAGRPGAARARLAAAIRRAPFSAGLWLERGEAALRAGQLAEARRAAARALVLAPSDAGACYRAALLLLQAGDAPRAARALRCVVERTPMRAREIFDLAHATYGDDARVLREVAAPGADGVRRFLAWAYERGEVDAAAVGWAALAPLGPLTADVLGYVDFLLAHDRVEAAETEWTRAVRARDPGLIFDGDFEHDPLGAGFGWRLQRLDGARTAIAGGVAAASGGRGLAIEFSGGNLDYAHVSQVVPVAGERRYRLSALVRSEDLTSLSGPRLEVEPHHACPGMATAMSEELRGTRPWRPVAVDFVTPPGCAAIVVRVRRLPTTRLDRDLRGRLYLDDVALADLGAAVGY